MRINSFLFNVEESWKIHISEEEIFEIVWIRKMFVVIKWNVVIPFFIFVKFQHRNGSIIILWNNYFSPYFFTDFYLLFSSL